MPGSAPDLNAPRLRAGALSGFAALGAGALATAISTPVLLHALGGKQFGLWVTLLAAVSFTGLLDFGFAQAAARFIGEYRARSDQESINGMISAIAAAYAVASILVMLAAAGIGLLLPTLLRLPSGSPATLLPALLIGLATASGLWMGFAASLLHAHQRLPLANTTRLVYWALVLSLSVAAALLKTGIPGLALAQAVSAFVALGIQYQLLRRALPALRLVRPRLATLRRGLAYSSMMFLISVGASIVFETDTLVIAGFRGVAAVAAYAIALRLTRGLTLVLHRVPEVVFPFYAGMRAAGNRAGMRRNFLLTARLELAGAAAVILGLGFAGRPLLAAWVGAGNVAASAVFFWAVLLIGMEALVHPAAVLAAAAGGERRMALVNNLEAVVNLGLSIAFVIRFGVAGVIAATVLAQALTNLWYLPRWAVRHLALTPRAYLTAVFWPALPATLTAVGAGLLVSRPLPSTAGALLGAVAAVGAFALVYYFMSEAGREEKDLVNGFLRRAA